MKLIKLAKGIFKAVPKLDPMIENITTSATQKKIIKSSVRIIQILAVTYLLYKGLIEPEQAIEVIKGK